jgi:hypothetical protein
MLDSDYCQAFVGAEDWAGFPHVRQVASAM